MWETDINDLSVGVLESDDLVRSGVCLRSYRSWIQPSSFDHI